jgi:hypothetical protein
MRTIENEQLESDKTLCIPKSISVAALLLIEWMQEQCQREDLDMAECQQTFVFDESLNQNITSR